MYNVFVSICCGQLPRPFNCGGDFSLMPKSKKRSYKRYNLYITGMWNLRFLADFRFFLSKCWFLFSAFFLSMGSIFFWFFPAPFLYITYRRRWRVNKPKTHAQYIALWCTVHVPCGNSLQPFLHVWLQWYTMISTIIIEKKLRWD